jgi:hypothetical protein
MSEHGDYVAPPASATTNGLGLAGFICALVGLCSGGMLSPVGLILSLVALKDRPRGFAIAGVIIGGAGSCGILSLIVLFVVAPLALMGIAGAAGFAGILGPQFEAHWEMAQINHDVIAYRDRTGALPLKMSDLNITDSELQTDPWGNPYVYELSADGMSYEIKSLGPDGVAGTPDDIVADNDFQISGQK